MPQQHVTNTSHNIADHAGLTDQPLHSLIVSTSSVEEHGHLLTCPHKTSLIAEMQDLAKEETIFQSMPMHMTLEFQTKLATTTKHKTNLAQTSTPAELALQTEAALPSQTMFASRLETMVLSLESTK